MSRSQRDTERNPFSSPRPPRIDKDERFAISIKVSNGFDIDKYKAQTGFNLVVEKGNTIICIVDFTNLCNIMGDSAVEHFEDIGHKANLNLEN